VVREYSDDMLEGIAQRFKALAEPMRLRILDALRRRERTVTELVELTGANQANVSKHLAVLHREGFVTRRRDGLHVHYRVSDPRVFALCDIVCGDLGRRAAQQARTFGAVRAARRRR
jgi:DNA-binding transcriptional ArsR family regulator